MVAELTFEQWVISIVDPVAEARGVSVEDLATEPAELSKQLARSRQHFVALGAIKADASSWVNKARAAAVQDVRKKYPEFTAGERKAMVDADPTYLKAAQLQDDVSTTLSALKSMAFEIMNDRRSNFVPQMHNQS